MSIKTHEPHFHNHNKKGKSSLKLSLIRFAHSNAYIAIPITAITLSTYMTVGEFEINFNYIFFLFFSTLFLYPLHRFIGLKLTIPVEYSQAQKAVAKKPNITKASIIVGLIGTLFFIIQLEHEVFQILLPLALISIAYSLPLLPTKNGWKRLRDIPGVKIYAISGVVTLTTSSLPLILLNSFNGTDIALLGIERFLFIFAITIPFDVRDIRIDQKWNLQTIPLIAGKENALKIAKGLVALSSLITVIHGFQSEILNWTIVVALLLANAWAIYIIEKFKTYNAPLFNAYMMEGTMVFKFALITIAQVLITL